MSVDPDDNTPGAIRRTGAEIVTYGAPVLPGAMFLLGYYEDGTAVMRPARLRDVRRGHRLRPGAPPSRRRRPGGAGRDLMALGEGGLCLGCSPSAISPSAPSASRPPLRRRSRRKLSPPVILNRISRRFHPALALAERTYYHQKGSIPHEEASLPAAGADHGPEPRRPAAPATPPPLPAAAPPPATTPSLSDRWIRLRRRLHDRDPGPRSLRTTRPWPPTSPSAFNFDSSGNLLTQIEEGAECDLFISAAPKQMNAAGRLPEGRRREEPRRPGHAGWRAAAWTCWRTR